MVITNYQSSRLRLRFCSNLADLSSSSSSASEPREPLRASFSAQVFRFLQCPVCLCCTYCGPLCGGQVALSPHRHKRNFIHPYYSKFYNKGKFYWHSSSKFHIALQNTVTSTLLLFIFAFCLLRLCLAFWTSYVVLRPF